jgi:hypothetical protein
MSTFGEIKYDVYHGNDRDDCSSSTLNVRRSAELARALIGKRLVLNEDLVKDTTSLVVFCKSGATDMHSVYGEISSEMKKFPF